MATTRLRIERSVWLFARPLSAARYISALERDVSEGKFHFCHWGVLTTELGVDMINELIQDNRHYSSNSNVDSVLGVMYDLLRTEMGNCPNVTKPFTLSMLEGQWPSFSAEHVGMTILFDSEIICHGILPMVRR